MSFVYALENRTRQLAIDSISVLSSLNLSANELLQQSLINNTDTLLMILQNISYIEVQVTAILNQTTLESTSIRSHSYVASVLTVQLTELQATVSQLAVTVNNIGTDTLEDRYTTLSVAASNISTHINQSIALVNQSNANLANITGLLSMTLSDIQYLQKALSEMAIGDIIEQDSIVDSIMLLNTSISQLMERFNNDSILYQNALTHANNIVTQGQAVCRLVSFNETIISMV